MNIDDNLSVLRSFISKRYGVEDFIHRHGKNSSVGIFNDKAVKMISLDDYASKKFVDVCLYYPLPIFPSILEFEKDYWNQCYFVTMPRYSLNSHRYNWMAVVDISSSMDRMIDEISNGRFSGDDDFRKYFNYNSDDLISALNILINMADGFHIDLHVNNMMINPLTDQLILIDGYCGGWWDA